MKMSCFSLVNVVSGTVTVATIKMLHFQWGNAITNSIFFANELKKNFDYYEYYTDLVTKRLNPTVSFLKHCTFTFTLK